MNRILIIDDDSTFLQLTRRFLEKFDHKAHGFQNWKDAEIFLHQNSVDLVLVDLHLEGISGIEIISHIKEINADLPILMITAHSSIQTAIESVKAGASDYIQKPCENSEILFKIERVLESKSQEKELLALKETVEGQFRFENLLTRDDGMKKIFSTAQNAANLDVIIHLSGETGTGKEMMAKAIHGTSNRKDLPFVVFNCAAVNENLVESELFGHKKRGFHLCSFGKKRGL